MDVIEGLMSSPPPLAGIKRKVKDVGLRIRNVKAKTKGSDHTVKQASLVSRAAGTEHTVVAITCLQQKRDPDDHLKAAILRVTRRVSRTPRPDTKTPPPEPTESLTPGLTPSKSTQTFLKEYELDDWVHSQSVNKGMAPPLTKVCKQRMALDSDRVKRVRKAKDKRQRLRRWRRRWSIDAGKFNDGELVSAADSRCKVLGETFHGFFVVWTANEFQSLSRTPGFGIVTARWSLWGVRLTNLLFEERPKNGPSF